MEQKAVFEKVVKILSPYAKDKDALAKVSESTNILEELKVNSARLVDVVLEFEDEFGIEIADDDVDGITTIGDCVQLIAQKAA
jgi:acyl carrier protein